MTLTARMLFSMAESRNINTFNNQTGEHDLYYKPLATTLSLLEIFQKARIPPWPCEYT